MEGGEGGGAKGDLCYSDALSVCAISKSLQTKGLNIWFLSSLAFISSPHPAAVPMNTEYTAPTRFS